MLTLLFSVPYIVYAVFLLISLGFLVYAICQQHNCSIVEIDAEYAKEHPKKDNYFNFMMGWIFITALFIGLMLGSIKNEFANNSDLLTFFSTVLVVGSIGFILMLIVEKVTRGHRDRKAPTEESKTDD